MPHRLRPSLTDKFRACVAALALSLATACGSDPGPSSDQPTAGHSSLAGNAGARQTAGGGNAASGGSAAGGGGAGGAANAAGTSSGGQAPAGGSSGGGVGGQSAGGRGGQAGEGGSATAGAGGMGGAAGSGGGTSGGGTSSFPISDGKPTVYLAGDSTVQTYSASQAPQQGWGQRIQEFFTNDVSFVNKAIGGRSSKSFIDEGRLDEITKLLKKGDYLFAQWGINDRYMSDPARYTNPATTFRDYLKQYISAARSKDAIPVLVTPTPRLNYTNGMFVNDFKGYCDAIAAVGLETNTPVIDLQTKALAYYTSVGYEVVERDLALDVLHFKEKGAYQMARLVAEGTSELGLPISPFVK